MTISHALRNIGLYRKRYGISKAIRAVFHYGFVALNKPKINSLKNYIVEVNGYKIEVIPNDSLGTSSELLMFKTHEPVSTELLKMSLKEGMTCLDIGGNIGYYVLLESTMIGEKGNVIVLEPSPENFEYLQKNIKLQERSNISAYNFAAGDTEGHLNFLIYENASNSGMIIPDGEKPRWPGEIIKVPVKRIDSFLNELKVEKLDLVRMDVEGYEYHIFQGMQETLKRFMPLIQIEVHKSIMGNEDTKKLLLGLQNLNYETKSYIPRDLDTPMIGTLKDVKYYTIKQIIFKLENDLLPSFFMLSLENKKSKHNPYDH